MLHKPDESNGNSKRKLPSDLSISQKCSFTTNDTYGELKRVPNRNAARGTKSSTYPKQRTHQSTPLSTISPLQYDLNSVRDHLYAILRELTLEHDLVFLLSPLNQAPHLDHQYEQTCLLNYDPSFSFYACEDDSLSTFFVFSSLLT